MPALPTCGWFESGSPLAAALSDVELFTKSPPVTWSGGGGAGGGVWGAAARAGAYAEPLGCSFVQLFQALPSLAWAYPLGVENRFNAFPWGELVRRYGWVPFLACALYCVACVVGVRVMAGRPALSLRGPLRAWNLGLAVFSAVGFLRTAPHLAHTIATQGLYVSVRARARAPAAGRWSRRRAPHCRHTRRPPDPLADVRARRGRFWLRRRGLVAVPLRHVQVSRAH